MMKNENRKKIALIAIGMVFLLLLSVLSTATVEAITCANPVWMGGSGGGSGGGGGGGGGGDGGGSSRSCALGEPTIYCDIELEKTDEEIILEEDVYDTKNNYLGKAVLIKDEYRFVAGRFIGIDAYEKYTKTFNVKIHATCLLGVLVCRLECHDTGYSCGGGPPVCSGCHCNYVKVCVPCSVKTSQCRGAADSKLEKLANAVDVNPSFEAKRQDVNDINEGLNGQEPTITVELSHESVDRGKSEPEDRESIRVSRTVTFEYTYNLTPAWIDSRTGRVKYEPVSEGSITEDEKKSSIKVPEMYTTRLGDTIRIGQYFVPLNAKSTDLLRYYLNPNMDPEKKPLSEGLCTSLIEKYGEKKAGVEHWSDFVADINGVPLKNRANTKAEALSIVKSEKGCRLALKVDFRIAQGFYNEVNTKKKNGNGSGGGNGGSGTDGNGSDQLGIKGYNFYYRPIDYSKPFPNGLTDDSYWLEVYDEKNNAVTVENASGNKLDLDDSFKAVTYATNKDYDLEVIRDYNKKEVNKYTSMAEMTISGTSNFISGAYGVTRYDCQTYYALGCGPSNSDWEQCQIRQTGVCKR